MRTCDITKMGLDMHIAKHLSFMCNLVFLSFYSKIFFNAPDFFFDTIFLLGRSENVVNMIVHCLPLQSAFSMIPYILKWDTCICDRLYMCLALHKFFC